MITPLPAALELYELLGELKVALQNNETEGYFWNGEYILLGNLCDRVFALDLKYPTNDNGIVIKEQK